MSTGKLKELISKITKTCATFGKQTVQFFASKTPKRLKIKIPDYAKKWLLIDLLGVIAGIAGGLGAVFFRLMIRWNNILFFDIILKKLSWNVGGYNLTYILLPALGGLIIGPLIMKFAPETKGHGVPEVLESVALKGGNIRKRVAIFKVAVSSVTIGSGGSAGREGPIAQIGATVGSLLGQLTKMDPKHRRLLVVCGLSAGIAGTFNAPLGGALFGMEILLRGVGLFNAMPVILSSVVGVAIASVFFKLEPAFQVPATTWQPPELLFYLLLGIIFGILAVLWVKSFYLIEDFFEILHIPNWSKLAVGGLLTGILLMLFPSDGIGGVGYDGIQKALDGGYTVFGFLFLLGLLKILATGFTVGSGGSGGIFAPSLYIGSMFGLGFGYIFQILFPKTIDHPYTFALAGMAALFAGAAQAPMNVIIMIPEMTGDYALIPPIMLTSFTSFFVAWILLRGSSIYTIKLERRGISLRMGRPYLLDIIKAGDVMTKNVITVDEEMPVSIVELMFIEHHHSGYPVTRDNELVGIVTITDALEVPEKERGQKKVKEIMSPFIVVTYPDETIHACLDKMQKHKIGRLPVVAKEDIRMLKGIITKHDIMHAYEIAAKKPQEELE
ncbi:MAG: chloride channel protein [Candidatus Heimdallarchaeaceae archaeon]